MSNLAVVEWRIVLCDLAGNSISVLSPIANTKQFKFPLNNPASFTCVVPSDNPQVAILHTDGDPFLSVGNRTIKAYRKIDGDEAGWVLKFAGIVWTIQDSGDGENCKTSVTAYDPFQLLTQRWVRDTNGKVYKTVVFNAVNGDEIAKSMVDRTIEYGGPCGISTDMGTFTAAPPQTAQYDQAFITPSLITMCGTGTLDLAFDPVDETDGILVAMSAMPQRGSDKPSVVIAYAAPGHSAFSLDRVISMDTFANDIRLWAGSTTGHLARQTDSPSIAKYYRYEDGQVLTDIQVPGLVDDLCAEDLALRKSPRDLLTILPAPESAPMPFRDYFIGDRITILSGVGSDQVIPQTRQAITGLQRVYGITIDVDDNGFERVSGLDVSPV